MQSTQSQFKNRKEIRICTTQTAVNIAATMVHCGIEVNHWGQKLRPQRCDEANAPAELLKECESKASLMHLGDGGVKEFQVYGGKVEAEIIRKAANAHYDVSFGCTFMISPTFEERIQGGLRLIVVRCSW